MKCSPFNELPGSNFGKLWVFSMFINETDLKSYIVLVRFWCQCFCLENEWGIFPSSVIVSIDFQDCFFLFSAWVCSVQIWISNVHEKQKARDFEDVQGCFLFRGQAETDRLPWLAGGFFSCLLFLRGRSLFKGFFFSPVVGVSVLTPHTVWLKASSLVLGGD